MRAGPTRACTVLQMNAEPAAMANFIRHGAPRPRPPPVHRVCCAPRVDVIGTRAAATIAEQPVILVINPRDQRGPRGLRRRRRARRRAVFPGKRPAWQAPVLLQQGKILGQTLESQQADPAGGASGQIVALRAKMRAQVLEASANHPLRVLRRRCQQPQRRPPPPSAIARAAGDTATRSETEPADRAPPRRFGNRQRWCRRRQGSHTSRANNAHARVRIARGAGCGTGPAPRPRPGTAPAGPGNNARDVSTPAMPRRPGPAVCASRPTQSPATDSSSMCRQ